MTDPFDPYRAARLDALSEVYRANTFDPLEPDKCPPPTEGYARRRIMRDVSQRFHAPLLPGSVEDWPWDEVLQHHYEAHYEELAESTDPEGAARWQQELELITEKPEERAQREAAERADRAGTDELIRKTEAENIANEAREAALLQSRGLSPGEPAARGAGMGLGDAARAEVASWGRDVGAGPSFPGGAGKDVPPGGVRRWSG